SLCSAADPPPAGEGAEARSGWSASSLRRMSCLHPPLEGEGRERQRAGWGETLRVDAFAVTAKSVTPPRLPRFARQPTPPLQGRVQRRGADGARLRLRRMSCLHPPLEGEGRERQRAGWGETLRVEAFAVTANSFTPPRLPRFARQPTLPLQGRVQE